MSGARSPVDSDTNIALTAYMGWLSQGYRYKMNNMQPINEISNRVWSNGKKKFAIIQRKATHKNYLNGKKLYLKKCSSCHGKNGAGISPNPPLWGRDKKTGQWLSYDANSGLEALHKAAIWIQKNMPFGKENTLKDQEAADIAIYITAQPHESFDTKKALRFTKGLYRSKYPNRKESVRNQFKKFNLDIDKIRGDKVIPK
jgi:thiosulfate dehydrogenase